MTRNGHCAHRNARLVFGSLLLLGCGGWQGAQAHARTNKPDAAPRPAENAAASGQAPLASPAPLSLPPDRLAVAKRIADHLIPDDAMARLAPQFFYMFGSSEDYAQMTVTNDLAASGLAPAPTATRPAYLAAARILDPAFDQRVAIIAGVSAQRAEDSIGWHIDDLRAAYARALTQRFTRSQLDDIAAFFETPSGKAFARVSLDLPSTEPFAGEIQKIMTATMIKLPVLQQRITAETAPLPPRRALTDLTPSERTQIFRALGIHTAPPQ